MPARTTDSVTPEAPSAPRPVRPVRDGIALGLAVGVSGLAFGAAAVSSGLSTLQACALSVLAFTGASQFALAGVIASGGSLLAGTAGAILLGSRNSLYGLRLAGILRPRGPLRFLTALGVIDETTAVTLAQPEGAELDPHRPRLVRPLPSDLKHPLRDRVRGQVEVDGLPAQEHVADGAADERQLVPGGGE